MDDKYVLLSGANGGIGSKILPALVKEGYKVIAIDLSNNHISSFDHIFIKCDVTKKEDINNAYSQIIKHTPSLFAIINTVGIFKMESLIEGNEDDFKKIFDINFFGIYSLTKKLFPLLKEDSRIINLSSEVARYSPQTFQAYYNLSKTALDGYTDALRREANYLNIKVIKIQSGSMSTSLLGNANDEFEKLVKNSPQFEKPLTKLKYMMDRELNKQNDPNIISRLITKILKKKKPKICYRVKNSFALFFMGHLPERLQDYIYKRVIK